MADKYYYGYAPEGAYNNTSDKTNGYSPTSTYTFTDKNGNTFSSLGDNGYVWQSVTEGIPIYINSKGQWYTEPYLERNGDTVTAYIPEWFKGTQEYSQWKTYASQIPNITINDESFSNLSNIMSSLGKQGSVRESLRYDISRFGVKDKGLQDKFVNDIVAVATEGRGKGNAKLNDLFGSNMDESAADVARSFQKKGKDEMSKYMKWLTYAMNQGANGTFEGTEKEMTDIVTLYRLLTYVDENHNSFGDNDEFNGLLEASTMQKLNAAGASFMSTLEEGTIFGLPARVAYGIGEAVHGRDFSLEIENGRNQLLMGTQYGGGLRGTESMNSLANITGTVANMAVTMSTSMYLGSAINAKVAVSAPGSFWSGVGTYMQTIPGAAVTDFFLNDVPIDLSFFVVDWARTGDVGKAWYNPEESQPLFGIPIVGHFGPQAPNGLAMNLLGDATVDAALPVLALATNTATKALDASLNGGVSRLKEKVAIKNLALQEKLTNIPIIGDAWKKFMNHMMGSVEANFIREKRKQAIIEGSMDPYIRAQNALTLKNHMGMEVVGPLYKQLDDLYNIQTSIKNFQKNANRYGGTGETRVDWKDAEGGVKKNSYHVVPDQLPKTVKQTLLDVERLSELRGEKVNDGGIIPDPARDKEIQTLETRIAAVEKKFPEIIDFANRFSDLNKAVDKMAAKTLGVKSEEWVAALNMDPRWEKYMTRQSLVPGFGSSGASVDPREAKVLNASRKGYYADNYIDPTLALGLKLEALGKAYAWNNIAEELVSAEIAQGKVVAGKGSVEAANRLTEIKEQLRASESFRQEIGYDTVVKSVDTDTKVIGETFDKINSLLHLPERISLESIYNATQDRRIVNIVDDFHSGKLLVDSEQASTVGLSDSDVASVIENTYKYVGMQNTPLAKGSKEAKTSNLWDKNGNLTVVAQGALGVKNFDDLKNENGEVDAGIFGLTRKQQEKSLKEAEKSDAAAFEEWSKNNKAAAEKYQEDYKVWLDDMKKFVDTEWAKRTDAQNKADPFAQKLYDKFEKEHPAPTPVEWGDAPKQKYSDIRIRQAALKSLAEDIVDSGTLPGVKFTLGDDGWKDENNFNYLTSGSYRRALYQKGYDNLDAKTKKIVDKADNMFTQRLTDDTVLYRGETMSAAKKRNLKVGDELDTSAWTYTQFLPEYTDIYRHGITGNAREKYMNTSEGVLYRYHMKSGSPVFHKPDYIYATDEGTHTEFIIPRGAKATVTNIEEGFLEPSAGGLLPFLDDSSAGLPTIRKGIIVDVEVDPGTGITPALNKKGSILASSAGEGAPDITYNVPDNISAATAQGKKGERDNLSRVNAGATADGRIFQYDIKDGRATNFKEITDEEGYAEAISHIGGVNHVSPETINQIGFDNARSLVRTVAYYRDNLPNLPIGPTFKMAYDNSNTLGWIPTPGHPSNQGEYGYKVVDGLLEAKEYPIYLASKYYAKGHEEVRDAAGERGARSGHHPKNSNFPESTAVHENGHNTMARLVTLEINRKVTAGELTLPENDVWALNDIVSKQWYDLHETLCKNAMEAMGIEFSEANWKTQAETISGYAATGDYVNKTYRYETFAEAVLDYRANGANASKFTLAIVEQVKQMSNKFAMAAEPRTVFRKNNLTEPKGLFKDTKYAFPSNVKTDKQKAKWLDGWRKKNPYLETEPIMVDGKDYAKNVTADNTKNIEGYKQFAADHMKRVSDTVLDKEAEDFALHVIRPGGDVDMYNSYLRGGDYKDTKDWARQYIDDVEDMYADEIEDLAFQFFPSDAEKIAKEFEVDFNEKGYWDTMIKYQDALKDMMADKLLQATKGNYELNDSSIFYRGVSTEGNSVNKGGDFSWLKEGGEFKDDGFGFISLSDVAAKGYASHGSGDKYVLEYHVPAGQRMFYFGEIEKGGGDGGAFVLPAGVTGKVGKITDLGDGIKKVEITLDGEWGSTKTKIMTEDQYKAANKWDTYFQKEIYSYDANSKSAMPEALAKKNGDFLEALSTNAAKRMVEEIEKHSIDGFSEELATMALSRDSADIAEAMETFIVKRINKAADEIAAKMPGGATAENVNRARLTMWSEDMVRNAMTTMISRLAPDAGIKNIQETINNLFQTQAKGFASVDVLPVETKKLIAQKEAYQMEIAKNNKFAREAGEKADKKLAKEGYIGNATQTIHYMKGGEDIYVVVSDPVVASILKRPNDFKETGVVAEALAQSANYISRLYRMGTTGMNPIAFVRNVLRDPLQATVQGGFNPLNMTLSPEVFYHTLRQYGLDDKTIATVSERIKTWATAGTLTEELRRAGLDTPNSLGYKSNLEKYTKAANRKLQEGKGVMGKIINVGEKPLEAWESMFRNQIGQQSFIKNFEKTRNVDSAMSAALFDASNSTTNFSHSVGLFKRATGTVPYLSSAINGTRSFWVQFNADPIGMVTRITAGFMVPVMAVTAWNLSNEERKKAYMNLPEWYRSTHMVLMDVDGNIFSLPIPDEIGNYFNVARQLIEYTEDTTPMSIQSIFLNGAFGFLPSDTDGFFNDRGEFDLARGAVQMASGLLPQAVTAIYEHVAERDLYTGQDLSSYSETNKWLNTLSNIFGTGIKSAINSIGLMMGVPEKELVGKSVANTLARDLFGMGFDNAKTQFMNMIGSPSKIDENGKKIAATGLFAESEELQERIEAIDKKIAVTMGDEKKEYEDQKQKMIDDFTNRVAGLTNNYMNLFSITGGLAEWQKDKIVSILMIGKSFSSARSDSYQYADSSEAYLNERSLAQQRYISAGLPGGPSLETLGQNDEGSYLNSIELQAAINRFYGTSKQATQDYKNAIKSNRVKAIRDEFYNAIQQLYDAADAQGKSPDYDLIEKIQARYLQSIDNVLVPIINQYGINILNNADFIDAVRKQVNGMIPSDDWRQSAKNAKKFLSTKEFPTATVDVKKWLKQRYSSGMKERGFDSDAEVTRTLQSIKKDIDAGNKGSAKGKIESLRDGINKSNYYISATDYQTLVNYYNMVK